MYVLSLIAATGFALASVAQYRASQSLSAELNLRISLLGRLFRNADFLRGSFFDVIGVVAQFFALTLGPVSIVQPILSFGLVLALGIEHRLARRKFQPLDIIASIITTLSLAYFVVLRGRNVSDNLSITLTLILALSILAWDLALLVAARIMAKRLPQLMVVGSAAISLGCGSVLEREVGLALHHGVIHTALYPPTWILIVLGPVSLLLVQSAFQLGALKSVLPMLTIGEPTVAILLSAVMLGETVLPLYHLIAGSITLAVMILSLLYLARSESNFRENVDRAVEDEDDD